MLEPDGNESKSSTSLAFKYWPTDPYWSFQLSRLLATSTYGGADFAECHLAARKMQPGVVEDWVSGWINLATNVRGMADDALAAGFPVTARNGYLRATNYFRAAEFFLQLQPPGTDEKRKEETYLACRKSFQLALPHLPHQVEIIEFPYQGSFLSAYFCHPLGNGPAPHRLIIFFGGSDSVAEELYFLAARAAVERGYAVLIVDGPGQGASLRLRHIYSRPDYEVPVSAAVDYALTRPEVDPRRIALLALSLGGYYAPRAAAFEKRLSACIAWGIVYDAAAVNETYPLPDVMVPHFARLFGTSSTTETLAVINQLKLKDIIGQIECPTLILHGEEDALVPVAQAVQAFDGLRCDRTLRVFHRNEPGSLHCQFDSLTAAHSVMFDWLDMKLLLRF